METGNTSSPTSCIGWWETVASSNIILNSVSQEGAIYFAGRGFLRVRGLGRLVPTIYHIHVGLFKNIFVSINTDQTWAWFLDYWIEAIACLVHNAPAWWSRALMQCTICHCVFHRGMRLPWFKITKITLMSWTQNASGYMIRSDETGNSLHRPFFEILSCHRGEKLPIYQFYFYVHFILLLLLLFLHTISWYVLCYLFIASTDQTISLKK